jgi:hypothetical protein
MKDVLHKTAHYASILQDQLGKTVGGRRRRRAYREVFTACLGSPLPDPDWAEPLKA